MSIYESVRKSGPPQDTLLLAQVEDFFALAENELHDLVLVDHVERHVSCVQFGPHQRRAEHDADALSGHQVLFGKGQDSVQVAEQQLHGVLVGSGQLLNQFLHCLNFLFGFFHLDGLYEGLEEPEGEQRLGQLAEKHLESSGDDVDVLPLTMVQVQVLLLINDKAKFLDRGQISTDSVDPVSIQTSLVNSVQTDLNKLRHRGSFTLAESQQMAAENSIFDEAFLLQSLHGRTPDDKLLQSVLHSVLVSAVGGAVFQLGAAEHVDGAPVNYVVLFGVGVGGGGGGGGGGAISR